ncbi:MAG: GTPase HflX, partial [Thermoplasmata archaeon]
LQYTYPRLSHMWTHLERVAGGASTPAAAVGGIGTRGPGEKQIEIDRRLVHKRITLLRRKLAAIDKQRQLAVSKRRQHFQICLVGYTNAGKSTLMNLLTSAGVSVADKLFETLDTRTRRWKLATGQVALLSDTVGFISRLPHHLVASFRATLEEVIGADLLLHVADASHRQVVQQIHAVNKVLDEIGCQDKDQILLLNKVDKIIDPTIRTILKNKYPHAIFISAHTGEGVERINQAVLEKMRSKEIKVTVEADCTNGRLVQYLAHHAHNLDQSYHNHRVRMTATIGQEHLAILRRFGEDVMILTPPQQEGGE